MPYQVGGVPLFWEASWERARAGRASVCPEGSGALFGPFPCAASVPRGAVLAERPAGRPGSRAMGRERVRRDVGGGAGGTGMNAQSPL